MLHIALCDDEKDFLNFLHKSVHDAFAENAAEAAVTDYTDGNLLLSDHKCRPFDAIFLDIFMPKIDGFEVAELVRQNFRKTYVIFVSSQSELVYDCFDYDQFGFVQKCGKISPEKQITKVVNRLLKDLSHSKIFVLKTKEKKEYTINASDIIFIESDKHYLNYHTKVSGTPICVRESIADKEQELSQYHFVKTHKQFLVNMNYVEFIDKNNNTIKLKGTAGVDIPISRLYREDVKSKYAMFIRSKICV